MSSRSIAIAAVALSFVFTAAVAIALWPDRDPGDATPDTSTVAAERSGDAGTLPGEGLDEATATSYSGEPTSTSTTPSVPSAAATGVAGVTTGEFALQPIPVDPPVQLRLKHPPAAGVLFDLDSGEVLWERRASAPLPIASLTKLMTALMVAEREKPGEQVLVSLKAGHTPGSATGLLPEGKAVPLEPLLQALLMISANDAAVALAEHYAGTVQAFIKQMNARAAAMGLSCSHFTTPNGLRDRGNRSCALDVAALARADLADKRIATIAQTRYAKPAFPIKGGRLHLANNHYFLQRGLAGVPGAEVTGLKTGFTDAAGRCYVTTARLGGTHLGVVLLGSPDPLRQVPLLLRLGFEEAGVLEPPPPKRPADSNKRRQPVG